MSIPGLLIGLATFPGVVVHEMAHQIFWLDLAYGAFLVLGVPALCKA